jgi:AraC family transcriptional regulator of adaptative response/methylated-DNA-[protein]-cysteine methyltransferase
LREVPPGQTTTFTEIARKLGTSAVRAVGHACSNNPLAIAIPCHRVLRKDGSLSGGTRWGNERQKILLEREDSRKSRTSASRQR